LSPANPGFLPAQFWRKFRAEILCLEQWANLDFAVFVIRIWTALDPVDGLFQRLTPPQPESGDQFFGLGKGPFDYGALAAGEFDPRALGCRL
jgi:hypothetical protein